MEICGGSIIEEDIALNKRNGQRQALVDNSRTYENCTDDGTMIKSVPVPYKVAYISK